jgi:LPXTG-motif cell wall-anchored protein
MQGHYFDLSNVEMPPEDEDVSVKTESFNWWPIVIILILLLLIAWWYMRKKANKPIVPVPTRKNQTPAAQETNSVTGDGGRTEAPEEVVPVQEEKESAVESKSSSDD